MALRYKDGPAMKPLFPILLALSLLGLSGCGPASFSNQRVQAKVLFSLEYGLQDRMLGLPEGRANELELYMREGIFHILDPTSKKILRTSSYGDLLSVIYDPVSSPSPSFEMPAGVFDESASDALRGGRYAARTSFVAPFSLGVDSSQLIYVADRLADPGMAIRDPLTGMYCDWIVRRFGKNGQELQFLGREGLLGSAFAKIISIDCLSDDSIVVVSSSGSLHTVYRFSGDARLLSSFAIDSALLPVPLELLDQDGGDPTTGKIHADLEGIFPMTSASGFAVILKINYYREVGSPEASLSFGLDDSGSWIFSMDGKSGAQKLGFKLAPVESAGEEWELLGTYKEGFLLASPQARVQENAENSDPQQTQPEERRRLRLLDLSGKALYSAEIRLPRAKGLLKSLRLSSTGQVYGIFLGESEAKVLWWELPF